MTALLDRPGGRARCGARGARIRAFQLPRAATFARAGDQHQTDPVPVHRQAPCRAAHSTPHYGSPAPRKPPSSRSSSRASRCTSRSTRRCRDSPGSRSHSRKRSSTARRAFGVPVDARIERGRSYRHALRQTIAHERYDRIVIAAAAHGNRGFDADDVAWLLDHAPGEIVVLRPSKDEQLGPPPRAHRPARGGAGADQPPRAPNRRARIERGPASSALDAVVTPSKPKRRATCGPLAALPRGYIRTATHRRRRRSCSDNGPATPAERSPPTNVRAPVDDTPRAYSVRIAQTCRRLTNTVDGATYCAGVSSECPPDRS